MIAKDATPNKKVKMERLALIKERYQKLILRQRQEIERELQDDFKESDDFDPDFETTAASVEDDE